MSWGDALLVAGAVAALLGVILVALPVILNPPMVGVGW